MAFSAQGGKKVAKVKLAKGPSTVTKPSGESGPIKMGDWIEEGSIIKTSPKSFVRLTFIDKSSMNVGPKSELKIEKFSKKDAGVINVLTGKIRSKVTKDYLQMDKNKSKLFVKSKNAVMGVRGTDFMFSTNAKTGNTTTVLFEGAIVFNKLPPGAKNLEAVVQAGRAIMPGQVSIAMKNKPKPTVPAKMNSKQFSKLEANVNMAESKVKKAKKKKSPVPPGLTGDVVASDNKNLQKEIAKVIKVDVAAVEVKVDDMASSKGFSNGVDEKPADGVMVHLDTGAVIQPAADATFDANTGEWVSTSMGDINAAGEYIPPENIDITSDGSFVTETSDGKLAVIPGMGEAILPVDQMVTFDEAPKVELPPEIAVKVEQDLQLQETEGPAPASDPDAPMEPAPMDQPLMDGTEPTGTEPVQFDQPLIPEEMDSPDMLLMDPNMTTSPTGTCENCAPLPIGASTLDPNAGSGTEIIAPPPPPPIGTTRVRVNVN